MNLKKSDKIIAVVGVIILIIAGISIAVIISSEKETEEETIKSGEGTFYVTWTKDTGEISLDGYAGKKAPYNEVHAVTAFGGVLTNVNFQLTWKDDCTYFGILSKGLDKLTAEISPAGGEPQTDISTGSGNNRTISFSVNGAPLEVSVEAEDVYEAEEIINEMFSGQDAASFDVIVTVDTGEKFRRPLKFLKDKGNSFELKIIYEYYYPVIESQEQGEYEGEDDLSDYDDWQTTLYGTISLPGRT